MFRHKIINHGNIIDKQSVVKIKSCSIILGVTLILNTFCFPQVFDGSMCVYVENSEKIFVGAFQKQTKKTTPEGKEILIGEFSIKQGLKGVEQRAGKISAITGVYAKRLQIGETYLVFLRYDNDTKQYIIGAPFPVVFLNDKFVKDKNPQNKCLQNEYQIAFGDIPLGELEELKKYKINIVANGKTYNPKFVPGGIFAIVFSKNIKANISIQTSGEFDVLIYGNPRAEIKTDNGQTSVKYDLEATNCKCDYRQFNFLEHQNK
jgi:hypothetical protein